MTETIRLAAHDPMPEGHHVVVLRRFEEDDPDRTQIQIILTGRTEQSSHPHHPDGSLMSFEQAIEAAGEVAEQEGLKRVFVLDRLDGPREHAILGHGGDHSAGSATLSDTDDEDGVRGSDMRDVTHPHDAG